MNMQKTPNIHIKQWHCLCSNCQPNKLQRKNLKRLDSKRVRQFYKKEIIKSTKGLKD